MASPGCWLLSSSGVRFPPGKCWAASQPWQFIHESAHAQFSHPISEGRSEVKFLSIMDLVLHKIPCVPSAGSAVWTPDGDGRFSCQRFTGA